VSERAEAGRKVGEAGRRGVTLQRGTAEEWPAGDTRLAVGRQEQQSELRSQEL